MKYSERYGYTKPADFFKRNGLDEECVTCLCSCFDFLHSWLDRYDSKTYIETSDSYAHLEELIWCFFMNKRKAAFWTFNGHMDAATQCLQSKDYEWYQKLDLIEFVIEELKKYSSSNGFAKIVGAFVQLLNETFIRLNYAFRIIGNQIVEITDDEEIIEIDEALNQGESIKTHISNALKLLADRPNPDYRNSIKESISAVEALCREITGKDTLGESLKDLERNGISIPTFLKSGFEKLYVYTNDKRTGIRHALLDESEVPQYEEAKYMVVTCSAFVNYVQGKRAAYA